MTAFDRANFIATLLGIILNIGSLVAGAILLSMAYQSWEYGIGIAALVFFHKELK